MGPVYGGALTSVETVLTILGAFLGFGFASSFCYVVNDLADREADANHPRKRLRPIASGRVSPARARLLAAAMLFAAGASVALVAVFGEPEAGIWTAGLIAIYVLNVVLYSVWSKHIVILDVIALAAGFVLRVLGGCAAVLVEPSTWLLNVTFFLAMFLAFGKRLGERRTVGDDAGAVRAVQLAYTDHLLRMLVVVTAVGTLLTYAGYVESRAADHTHELWGGWPLNVLWLTIAPATFGLLRCIVLLEQGRFDDPTELASKDRPFQLSALLFAGLTGVLLWSPVFGAG